MKGAVYLGTEQFITLATVLSILGGAFLFLFKHQFKQITDGIAQNANKIDEQIETLNARINKIKEKVDQDITGLREELGNIKGDFAITFVQREEFYRYLNGIQSDIKDTNTKVDQILMLMTTGRDGRKGNGA